MFSFILNYLNKIKKFPYYFLTPVPYAFGTAALDIFITLQNLKKKKLIILKIDIFNKLLNYKICNHSLHDDLSEDKYIYNLPRTLKKFFVFFLSIEFFFKRLFVLVTRKLFNIKYNDQTCFLDVGLPFPIKFDGSFKKLQFDKIKIQKNKINLKLNKNVTIFLKKKITNFFFDNKPYVILHVRDGGYRNDYKFRSWRNSDIENYNQSIDYLISKGFRVVKIGDKNSKRSSYQNKFFYDYANSELKSDAMDLYLIKNSSFFIGNYSGPESVASMFSKPKLITNGYKIIFNSYSTDRILLKKIFYENKEISLIDYLNLPAKLFFFEYPHKKITFKENSSLEIFEATKEFVKLYQSNFKIKPTSIQNKINKLIQKRCSLFLSEEYNNLKNKNYNLWIIYWMKAYSAHYSNYYLKEHFKKFELTNQIKIRDDIEKF